MGGWRSFGGAPSSKKAQKDSTSLSRDEQKVIAGFENGGECLIEVNQAMAARERILAREGLAYWLPRLEVRQERLAERLRRLLVTNELVHDLLAHELNCVVCGTKGSISSFQTCGATRPIQKFSLKEA